MDSGFAALSNFAVGLFAVGTLDSEGLALYSLFFSGWIVSQLLPAQTVYLPARLAVNALSTVSTPNIGLDVRRGIVAVTAAPALVALAGVPLARDTGGVEYFLAAASVAGLTVVSPIQDHIRASLHLANMHGSAALVSATTAASVAMGLIAARLGGGTTAESAQVWIPFAVLLAGNIVGLTFGLRLLSGAHRGVYELPTKKSRFGYLGPSMVSQSNVYLINVVTATYLGASSLATLETARIMASPVLVVVTGLATYITPTTIRHFVRRNTEQFRRRLVGMVGTILIVGAIYSSFLLVLRDHLDRVFGQHSDAHLGAARTLVTSIDTSSTTPGSILFTAGRFLLWNTVAVVGTLVTLAALVPCMLVAGVFGVPMAQGLGALVKTSVGVGLAARSQPRSVVHDGIRAPADARADS